MCQGFTTLLQQNIGVKTVLPKDLETLLQWHNGNKENTYFGDLYSYRFLSIREIEKEWSFYLDENNEFLEPYKKEWVPLLSNGSSDYMVYEIGTGKIIDYYHDDPDRNSIENLDLWSQQMITDLEESIKREEKEKVKKSKTGKWKTVFEGIVPSKTSIILHVKERIEDESVLLQIREALEGSERFPDYTRFIEEYRLLGKINIVDFDFSKSKNGIHRSSFSGNITDIYILLLGENYNATITIKSHDGNHIIEVDDIGLEYFSELCKDEWEDDDYDDDEE